MTALVIVITGTYTQAGLSGVELTSAAFAQNIAWFPYVLALAVVLFAFSTMISWSYYGVKAATYLFGESALTETLFKVVFCTFTLIGAVMQLDAVIAFSDSMIFAMSLANVVGLYILAPEVKRALGAYWRDIESGAIRSRRELARTGD